MTRLELGFDVNGRSGLHSENTTRGFDAWNRSTGTLAVASIEDARPHRLGAIPLRGVAGQLLSVPLGRRPMGSGVQLEPRVVGKLRQDQPGRSPDFWQSSRGRWPRFSSRLSSPGASGNRHSRTAISRDQRPRPDSRQPQPGAGNQPAVGTYRPGGPEATGAWDLFLYRYQIRHLVERFEAEPQHFYFRNRGSALLTGVEAELHRHIGEGCPWDSEDTRPPAGPEKTGTPSTMSLPLNHHDRWKNAGIPEPPTAPKPYLCPGLQIRPHGNPHPGFATLDLSWSWLLDSRTQLRFLART